MPMPDSFFFGRDFTNISVLSGFTTFPFGIKSIYSELNLENNLVSQERSGYSLVRAEFEAGSLFNVWTETIVRVYARVCETTGSLDSTGLARC